MPAPTRFSSSFPRFPARLPSLELALNFRVGLQIIGDRERSEECDGRPGNLTVHIVGDDAVKGQSTVLDDDVDGRRRPESILEQFRIRVDGPRGTSAELLVVLR